MNAVNVGLDDGYAYTKVALSDGRLVAIPSRAKLGRAHVTWLDGSEQKIFEYETDGQQLAVGDVNGEPTHFDAYPFSNLNRVIVQDALQRAGLAGQSMQVVSGLPVSNFYHGDGTRRDETIARKQMSLKKAVHPLDGRAPVGVAFHEVIPEALAAWYDVVINDTAGEVALDPRGLDAPIAIVDIGGRTTDYVVVAEQAVQHDASGSLRCGLLDVKQAVGEGIRHCFDLEVIAERTVDEAMRHRQVRLFGVSHDIDALVDAAERQVVERIHVETQRQLGCGAELDRVLFVGGGAVALASHLRSWFPNQVIAEHAAFANARGMLKYLRYVCEVPSE